jgi:hypothetical protein
MVTGRFPSAAMNLALFAALAIVSARASAARELPNPDFSVEIGFPQYNAQDSRCAIKGGDTFYESISYIAFSGVSPSLLYDCTYSFVSDDLVNRVFTSASAAAGHGRLGVSGLATSNLVPNPYFSMSIEGGIRSKASLADYLFFSGPPLATARFNASFTVEGGPIVVRGVNSYVSADLSAYSSIQGGSVASSSGTTLYHDGSTAVNGPMSTFSLPFDFDVSFDQDGFSAIVSLNAALDSSVASRSTIACEAGVCEGASGYVSSPWFSTMYWDGISSATVGGVPINYTVISSSGFNYRNSARPAASVPGPLSGVGAAAAFGFSRKLRNRIKNRKDVFSQAGKA